MIDIICKCQTCRYSEYNKCSNEKVRKEFEQISIVKEVCINSFKCSEFSEERWVHDVE